VVQVQHDGDTRLLGFQSGEEGIRELPPVALEFSLRHLHD
jgi:hypothetical protein